MADLNVHELAALGRIAPGADPELIRDAATTLIAVERNYYREGSCPPGSRFEGQRLEVVQALALLKLFRERPEVVSTDG